MANYNSYTDEDRAQARELLEQGLPAAEVSRRLNIPERTVRQWRADWGISGRSQRRQSGPAQSSGKSGWWKAAVAVVAIVGFFTLAFRR